MKYPSRKLSPECRIALLESKVKQLEEYRFRCCAGKKRMVNNLIDKYSLRIEKLTRQTLVWN